MTPPPLDAFTTLTFDCYGTLIDWESGILAVLRPWAAGHRVEADDAMLLAAFARHESAVQEEQPSALYPDVLAEVQRRIAADFGLAPDEADAAALAHSVGAWPAFPDSAEALARLARHYRLMVLSNVDRASFARSNEKLGVTFDAVFTAEDIGSYKPDPRNFAYLRAELEARGIAPSEVLHTAQSLFHDIAPARAAGFTTNWIDRAGGRPGATPPAAAEPDYTFASLADFADARERLA